MDTDIIGIIDIGIKYRHNRYNRYCYNTDIKDIIDVDKKYRFNIGIKYRYNRYRYNI